jgi:hypothetical protein
MGNDGPSLRKFSSLGSAAELLKSSFSGRCTDRAGDWPAPDEEPLNISGTVRRPFGKTQFVAAYGRFVLVFWKK